jgi:hypothetical protein
MMSAEITLWQNPLFGVILAIIYLTMMVSWMWFIVHRLDPWLREKVGARFGVTIIQGRRGHWQVKASGKGLGGCLIEMLQIVFWIPAIMLPMVIFVLTLILLNGGMD